MKLTTTLNELKKAGACTARYRHLCKKLGGHTRYGGDTPITLKQILDCNGADDCYWAIAKAGGLTDAWEALIARLDNAWAEDWVSITAEIAEKYS